MGEVIATRAAYGKALVKFGETVPELIVMDADLAGATMTNGFAKAFPERFLDMGIAEADMMGVAAGLAACGKKVFATSFAMFAAGRAWEQVRNSICYPRLGVKVVGSHGGLSVGEDGATHQCNEDIALMRSIPGMVVMSPSDPVTTRLCVKAAIEHDGPCYIRTGRNAVPNVDGREDVDFTLGRGIVVRDGTDVTLVATGYMLHNAVAAADLLAEEGISAAVLEIHTIKPLDDELIATYAKKTGAIVTAEEHNIRGGLGSAVCESVCASGPVPVKMVGMPDCFGRSGKFLELFEYYHMTAKDIAAAAREVLAKK